MCMTSTLGPHCSGEAYLEQLSGPKEYKARLVRVFSLESKSSVLGTPSLARPDAWKVGKDRAPPPAPLALCGLPCQPRFLFPWHQPIRDTKDLHGPHFMYVLSLGRDPGPGDPAWGQR